MAGGSFAPVGVVSERAEQYQGKVTTYVIIACIVAAIGGQFLAMILEFQLLTGGVTSMDGFLEKFFHKVYKNKKHAEENNYCKYNSQGLAAFTSSLYLAGLVSSLAITRNYGRRASILCGGISFLVGALLDAFALNLAMLIFGRIMLGVGIGFGNQAVPLYLSEMAPTHLRGGLNIMFQLATTSESSQKTWSILELKSLEHGDGDSLSDWLQYQPL